MCILMCNHLIANHVSNNEIPAHEKNVVLVSLSGHQTLKRSQLAIYNTASIIDGK